MRGHVSFGQINFDLAFAFLPIDVPKPGLSGWDGDHGAQFDDTVGPLGEFDLGAGLVELVFAAQCCWQRDETAGLHGNDFVDRLWTRHGCSIAAIQQYCQSAARGSGNGSGPDDPGSLVEDGSLARCYSPDRSFEF